MKDQFLFVYSLLVIHTQQVFYSHKKPTIWEWIHLQLVGNILIVLTCIYILYILYILYQSIQFKPNQFNPFKYQSIQFKPNQFNPSISNIQYPISKYPVEDLYMIQIIILLYLLLHYFTKYPFINSIQFNSIQFKYQFIQQIQLPDNQHV